MATTAKRSTITKLWFDHHGIFDNVLHVPLIIRYPGAVPAGERVSGFNQHKDLLPTCSTWPAWRIKRKRTATNSMATA